MKMPYWLFIIICKITSPGRWLLQKLPFVRYPNAVFAMQLLFGSKGMKFELVFAHAQLESGKMDSTLAVKYKNYFAMGKSISSRYQDGSVKLSTPGEPIFATYNNDYKSVYDYYNLLYDRNFALGKYIDSIQDIDVSTESAIENNKDHIKAWAIFLKSRKYYTSDSTQYGNNLVSLVEQNQSNRENPWASYSAFFWYCILSGVVLVGISLALARKLYRLYTGKSKISVAAKKAVKEHAREAYETVKQRFKHRYITG